MKSVDSTSWKSSGRLAFARRFDAFVSPGHGDERRHHPRLRDLCHRAGIQSEAYSLRLSIVDVVLN